MKRILYLMYFIKKSDYGKLKADFQDLKRDKNLSHVRTLIDMIAASLKYKSSFHDYFLFEFYRKNHKERDSYLTTGRSYEFYTALNDKNYIRYFRNKAKFLEKFGGLFGEVFCFWTTVV